MGANPSVEPANSRPVAMAQNPRQWVLFTMVVECWIAMFGILFFRDTAKQGFILSVALRGIEVCQPVLKRMLVGLDRDSHQHLSQLK
jgi:hypothetical protein